MNRPDRRHTSPIFGEHQHCETQCGECACCLAQQRLGAAVGRRSPPGLDTPSPPSETDELEIESRETIVTGASSPAAIPRRPDGWRALQSGSNGQMSLPRPVRFDYKPRGPQANTHYTVQARKERQKADALAQRTSYATGGHLSGRRELTYGSGYSTSTARAHQTIVKGHTQDSMRVRAQAAAELRERQQFFAGVLRVERTAARKGWAHTPMQQHGSRPCAMLPTGVEHIRNRFN